MIIFNWLSSIPLPTAYFLKRGWGSSTKLVRNKFLGWILFLNLEGLKVRVLYLEKDSSGVNFNFSNFGVSKNSLALFVKALLLYLSKLLSWNS